MSVRGRQSNGRADISLPTSSNRDLGTFLIFVGFVGIVPMHYVLRSSPEHLQRAGVVGLLLAAVGLWLVRFSRKRFVVSGQEMAISDGLFKRPLRYRWEGTPAIKLRPQEEERGSKVREYWLVYLVDGKRQYALDHREGSQIESRSLAEALAKSINCPVIEVGDGGKEVRIERSDLDLPFVERVKRWPSLLGPEVAAPENGGVTLEETDKEQRYCWRLMSPGLMSEAASLLFLLFLLALVPLLPGKQRGPDGETTRTSMELSFLDVARREGDYRYFYVVGGISLISMVGLFGYSKELVCSSRELTVRDRLWGVAARAQSIPAQELEEIWVRKSSRGAHLQFISDARILSGRIASADVASWVASKVRRYYAAQS